MTAYLRPGVHAATISADLVLLDIDDDSYLCLPGGAKACRNDARGQRVVTPGAVADALRDAGFLHTLPTPPGKTLPSAPTASIIHEPLTRRSRVADFIAAAGVVRDIRRARAGAGLASYLAIAGTPGSLSHNPAAVLPASRVFWALAPWLPLEGECLMRSAMLVSFLRRRGLAADWVFGVRLWPFGAHCWVQSGETCLNDDFEQLAAYTPILCR